MKIRRVTLEVEVPWTTPAEDVLLVVGPTLDKLAKVHQAQVVKDERSPNKRIGYSEFKPLRPYLGKKSIDAISTEVRYHT
jgi:hypothetical protein